MSGRGIPVRLPDQASPAPSPLLSGRLYIRRDAGSLDTTLLLSHLPSIFNLNMPYQSFSDGQLNGMMAAVVASDRDLWLGEILIVSVLSAFFMGIISFQVTRYFRNYPGDIWPLRALVAWVGACCIATTCFTFAWGYTVFVATTPGYAAIVKLQFFGTYFILTPLTVVP